jgi:SAM-dependent methyltransferase
MMTTPDFSATVERFTGFAPCYDQTRPAAPQALADLLLPMARCPRPKLVVDLGCGTGLSTRYWAPYAEAVIGIDPTDAMREQAERNAMPNLTFRKGFSHATGLPDQCADLVLCGQCLHWMEPVGTFAESARILRAGGVFASYDYDWPPATGFWEVDQAYSDCMDTARRLEKKHGITDRVLKWDKDGHLGRLRDSGQFRYVQECLLHHVDTGNAARIVGVLLSQGSVQSLLKLGVSEQELGIDRLRTIASQTFGETTTNWHWSVRIRLGVR